MNPESVKNTDSGQISIQELAKAPRPDKFSIIDFELASTLFANLRRADESMESSLYSIRKNFLFPLGLVVLLSIILLITAIFLNLPLAKIIILSAFLIPVFLLFIESSLRRVQIGDSSLQVNKLFRKKKMNYEELTAIDTIRVRKRAFISLSSENDLLILSNSYEHFGHMIRELIQKVPTSVVSEETRELAEHPPSKCSDVFSAWLAVAVLALIIFVQLRGAA